MKAWAEVGFLCLLAGMLLAMELLLGHRVFVLAASFSALWFVIAMVLMHRPPGIPEFVSEDGTPDEQYVIRKDVLPRLPLLERFRWSLCVACGSCLLIWLTLGLIAR